MEMMRYADEIVSDTELDVPDAKPATPRELELALGLISALSGPFDATKHPEKPGPKKASTKESKKRAAR